jgi:hypothetical protein
MNGAGRDDHYRRAGEMLTHVLEVYGHRPTVRVQALMKRLVPVRRDFPRIAAAASLDAFNM